MPGWSGLSTAQISADASAQKVRVCAKKQRALCYARAHVHWSARAHSSHGPTARTEHTWSFPVYGTEDTNTHTGFLHCVLWHACAQVHVHGASRPGAAGDPGGFQNRINCLAAAVPGVGGRGAG